MKLTKFKKFSSETDLTGWVKRIHRESPMRDVYVSPHPNLPPPHASSNTTIDNYFENFQMDFLDDHQMFNDHIRCQKYNIQKSASSSPVVRPVSSSVTSRLTGARKLNK